MNDLADMEEEPLKRARRRAATPFMAAGLTPQLQRNLMAISKSVNAQLPAAQLVAQQFSEQHGKMFADLARVTVPKFDLPKIVVPALKLDYQVLFPNLEKIKAQILRQLEPTFCGIT